MTTRTQNQQSVRMIEVDATPDGQRVRVFSDGKVIKEYTTAWRSPSRMSPAADVLIRECLHAFRLPAGIGSIIDTDAGKAWVSREI